MHITRRKTKQITVGSVKIGGDAAISVQSMCSTDTRDINATVEQIRQLETAGPALTAFGMLPLSDSWQLYARVGMLFADTDLTTSINGSSDSSSIDSDSTTVGAGAQYDWGGHWSARLDLQRTLELGGDDMFGAPDVDTISLGFLYRL